MRFSPGSPEIVLLRTYYRSIPIRQSGADLQVCAGSPEPAVRRSVSACKQRRLNSDNRPALSARMAADRGEVEETALTDLARLWEGACAKSSGRRSSRKKVALSGRYPASLKS